MEQSSSRLSDETTRATETTDLRRKQANLVCLSHQLNVLIIFLSNTDHLFWLFYYKGVFGVCAFRLNLSLLVERAYLQVKHHPPGLLHLLLQLLLMLLPGLLLLRPLKPKRGTQPTKRHLLWREKARGPWQKMRGELFSAEHNASFSRSARDDGKPTDLSEISPPSTQICHPDVPPGPQTDHGPSRLWGRRAPGW